MGRGKLSLNLIPNRKSRISTFKKRKNSLLKKAYELSTLCDVGICVFIHGPGFLPTEYHSRSDVEFQSWPSNRSDVEGMIRAYKATSSFSDSQKLKRCDLTDYFTDRKRKKIENSKMCPKWDDGLECLSEDELREFIKGLDAKIESVNGMIECMESEYGDLFGELCSENTVSPVVNPSVEEFLPIEGNNNLMEEDLNEIRYLEMLLGEEEEGDYTNLMNDEFDYFNDIERLMMI